MWETPGSVFRLDGFKQVTQSLVYLPAFCFPFCCFSMTVFKREIISQSVLTLFFFWWCKIRNAVSASAVSQPTNFFYIRQHGFKFSSWLMVNSLIWYLVHLQSATKFTTMLKDTCDKMCAPCISFVRTTLNLDQFFLACWQIKTSFSITIMGSYTSENNCSGQWRCESTAHTYDINGIYIYLWSVNVVENECIYILSIYTLSDLGNSSNLIG